jgi:hypothetical protein
MPLSEEEVAAVTAQAKKDSRSDPRSGQILRALKQAGYSVRLFEQKWADKVENAPGLGYAFIFKFTGVRAADQLTQLLRQLFDEYSIRPREQTWPDPEHQRIVSNEVGDTAIGFFLLSRDAEKWAPQEKEKPEREPREKRVRPEREGGGGGLVILGVLVLGGLGIWAATRR